MRPTSSPGRGRFAVALTTMAVLVAAVVAAPSFAAKRLAAPPNGVYTCTWIEAHAEAATAAGVTCDPAVFAAVMAGQIDPMQESSNLLGIMSVGCQYVPSSGSVGQGVFAWGTYQYSTYWGWYGFNSPANYTWYVQKTGADTYTWGNVSDTNIHEVGVPANIYRWGAQNHSSTAQRWDVCWNDY